MVPGNSSGAIYFCAATSSITASGKAMIYTGYPGLARILSNITEARS